MSDDSREVIDVIAMNWCLNKQKSAVTKHTNCSIKSLSYVTVSSYSINNPFTDLITLQFVSNSLPVEA